MKDIDTSIEELRAPRLETTKDPADSQFVQRKDFIVTPSTTELVDKKNTQRKGAATN